MTFKYIPKQDFFVDFCSSWKIYIFDEKNRFLLFPEKLRTTHKCTKYHRKEQTVSIATLILRIRGRSNFSKRPAIANLAGLGHLKHCYKLNCPPEPLDCLFHVQNSPWWRGCGLAGWQAKTEHFGALTDRHRTRPAPKRNLRPPKIQFFFLPVSIDKQIQFHLTLVFWNKRLLHQCNPALLL